MLIHVSRHGQIVPPTADRATPFAVAEGAGAPGAPNARGGADEHRMTELGRRQARCLGERLVAAGFAGRVYASPYHRTVETAQIVAECVDAPVVLCPAIREHENATRMATFRGATLDQLRQPFPRVDAEAGLTYPWWGDETETSEHVKARVGRFIDGLIDRGGEDALLIGHGASMWAGVTHLVGRFAAHQLANMPHPYTCALTSVRIQPTVELVNRMCVAHMHACGVTSNEKAMATVHEEQRQRRIAEAASR